MNPKVKLSCTAIIVLVLLAAGTMLQAMPKPAYFAQDDFTLVFGSLGDPLAVGTSIEGSGRLLDWNTDKFAGWFSISAIATAAGTVQGSEQIINLDSGTFKITSAPNGLGTTLWLGTVKSFQVKVHTDPALRYNANNFPRPTYETQPEEYIGIGSASFARTNGTWTDNVLGLDWFGSYNWNFDADTPQDSSFIMGNLQGRLAVPEPGSIAMLACGCIGLAGCIRRRSR